MLSASASPSVSPSAQLFPSLVVPAVDDVTPGVPDSALMAMLGGALIALQLRRRQKSLRSPRVAIVSN
jgi:hypothetical protein